ncbi:MAG: radical SAM protein [Xanthomonadales bacterium]|nr:radical SAM protein [Gammaproteobacteria bacterium]NND57247.1 radical SAM protein [Xanthomonadales bacterium]NNK52367.1 radical SAM protein [Xanthomonadales bacterium]
MNIDGLHLLLTYQCNFKCDHCFVWGGPDQYGTMTLGTIREILKQAQDMGTVEWIYFEGGEPFLYYAMLQRGVEIAARAGFKVGIVSNAYWATETEDALACLEPLKGRVQDLSISSDAYHWNQADDRRTRVATEAAQDLGIPLGVISVAPPEATHVACSHGQIAPGESAVVFRGRAAQTLTARADKHPWEQFTECPFEDLREPGRVHLDPLGYVHICQGITLGNLLQRPLSELFDSYDPANHPVTGPLLDGGPAELLRRYDLPCHGNYCDACHLCDTARRALRSRFPGVLGPDQMYGE